MARKLAVIGAGLMGSGIAQVSAQAGWDVVLRDITDEALKRGTDGIKASYDKFVGKGKLAAHDADAALSRITATTDLDAAADADVVVEGDAARVTEPGAVARVAKAWAGRGWPAEPDDSGSGITAPFNAPSQGPPPWNVYRIEPRSAIVTLAAEPGGLTRFRF